MLKGAPIPSLHQKTTHTQKFVYCRKSFRTIVTQSHFVTLIIVAVMLRASPLLAQGVLADPSFESGLLVTGGVGGWDTNSGSAVLAQGLARTGNWSAQANYGATIMDPSMICQWVVVQPNNRYALSGWGLTPVQLTTTTAFLFLRFSDINHNLIGLGNRSGEIDASSPVNTWVPLSVTATAPTGAAYAQVIAGTGLIFNFNPQIHAVYFDDLDLKAIPEPHTPAVLTPGLAIWLCLRRGRWCRWPIRITSP